MDLDEYSLERHLEPFLGKNVEIVSDEEIEKLGDAVDSDPLEQTFSDITAHDLAMILNTCTSGDGKASITSVIPTFTVRVKTLETGVPSLRKINQLIREAGISVGQRMTGPLMELPDTTIVAARSVKFDRSLTIDNIVAEIKNLAGSQTVHLYVYERRDDCHLVRFGLN